MSIGACGASAQSLRLTPDHEGKPVGVAGNGCDLEYDGRDTTQFEIWDLNSERLRSGVREGTCDEILISVL